MTRRTLTLNLRWVSMRPVWLAMLSFTHLQLPRLVAALCP